MEFFHEMKNKCVLPAIMLVNNLARKNPSASEPQWFPSTKNGLEDDFLEKCGFFRVGKNGFSPLCSDEIPVRLSRAERIWLKACLNDPRASLFLQQEEICRLRKALAGEPDYSRYLQSGLLPEAPDIPDEAMAAKVQTVLQAIREHRTLSYVNTTSGGEYHNEATVPFCLEYSVSEDVFRLTTHCGERTIKSNLSRMSGLVIGEHVEAAKYKEIKASINAKLAPEPIVIRVNRKRQSIERAVMLFSNYDRSVNPVHNEKGELQHLELSVYYHTFDEYDLIQKILSFGPNAKVLSPASVIEQIKAHISGLM